MKLHRLLLFDLERLRSSS